MVFNGALYHPPKPIYQVDALLDQIEGSVEELTLADASALFVFARDLNQLDVNTVAERTGLTLVKVSTRNLLQGFNITRSTGYLNLSPATQTSRSLPRS